MSEMGRYPFREGVNEFLKYEEGHISESTFKTTRRRLLQISGIFVELKANGEIASTNPRNIQSSDVDRFVAYRKKNGMKNTTILKDLGLLEKLLTFFDNDSVRRFKAKYPAHVPRKFKKRGPSMDEDIVQMIIDRAKRIDVNDWTRMEAYGVVVTTICTGLRPLEIQKLSIQNVNDDGEWIEIYAEHVKGEGTYGSERYITVHPDGAPVVRKYVQARRLKLEKVGKYEDAFVPPLKHIGGYVCYNKLQKLKNLVERELEIRFDYRKCRRTYGQRAINEGQSMHDVSLVMGHCSMATTQKDYCDKEEHVACRDMKNFWDGAARNHSEGIRNQEAL